MSDKINKKAMKEKAMEIAGLTQVKYMTVIAEALEAVIKVETMIDGKIEIHEEPDWARRQWGSEQCTKLFGDQVERKEIEATETINIQVTHSELEDRLSLLSRN